MRPACLATRAPAKINLTLHITGRRLDGWHELVSLVAFAGVGDHVGLIPDRSLILLVDGPTGALTGPDQDNLVLRAARSLAARVPDLRTGEFRLYKRLPVASGMGGGSSDAAAALRLLAQLNGMSPLDHRLIDAARSTGADVPVCLDARARVMQGTGERLGPLLGLPPLFAVLVNPAVGLETKRVFARMGLQPGSAGPGDATHLTFSDAGSFDGLLRILGQQRNDMEAAAEALLPVIGEQLHRLAAEPGCRLARMSGSGATCFGIFSDRHAAAAAARALRHARPDWWVRATILR